MDNNVVTMKKNKITLAGILATSFVAIIAIATGTFAWFAERTLEDPVQVNINGSVSPYFYASGTGRLPGTLSEDDPGDPFIIKEPLHLSNLAWLQYLGTYNKDDNSDHVIDQQYCFKLSDDIPSTGLDMTGYTLPPIGTEDNPFLGYFDGNNKKIINLTTSNKESDFGTRKPANISYTAPQIVGFFGAVGEIDIDPLDYTYSSSVNQLVDFELDNINIETDGTSNVLVGLAAGYVNGDMSGVKVGKSTLNLNGQSSTRITDKLSDYGLVGYTTRKGNTGSTYTQNISRKFDINNKDSGGENWGGSIPILEYNMFIYRHFLDKTQLKRGYEQSTMSTSSSTLNSSANASNGYDIEMYYQTYPSTPNVRTNLNSSGNDYSSYMAPDSFNINPLTGVNFTGGKNGLLYKLADGAYIPLKFQETDEDDWEHVHANNTGYIVGKNNSVIMSSVYHKKMGNSFEDGEVGYSAAGSPTDNLYDENTPLEIVTYSKKVGRWCLIDDSKNHSHSITNKRLEDLKNYKYTSSYLELSRYDDAREQLETSLLKSYRLNGIQFTNSTADGSLPATTTISTGLKIMGKTNSDYPSYQVPKGYINFSVKNDGFISLFGGTYNANTQPTTMTFFSLYKVNRNANGTLSSLQRISEVFDNTDINPTDPYVYKYSNGSYSDSHHGNNSTVDLSASLEATLPMNSGSSSRNNMIYYFEIPVNAGEYAIGMVPGLASGVSGANLIYLDIGTNGSEGDRDELTAYSVTTYSNGVPYPSGVDFATGDLVSTNGGETLGIIVSSSSNGAINFDIDGNNITYSSTVATQYAYSVKSVVSASPPSAAPPSATNGVRMIYIEARVNSSNWIIHIREVLDGSGNVTSTTYPTISQDGVPRGSGSIPSMVTGNMERIKTWLLEETVVILERVSGTNEFDAVPTYSGSDNKTVSISLSLAGISIRAKSKLAGYTVSINGVTMTTDPQVYS